MLSFFLALAQAEPIELRVWHAYRDAEQDVLLSLLDEYDKANPYDAA